MVKVVPIVEGHGEQEAVPVLLRRIINDRNYNNIIIDKAWRIPSGQYFNRDQFRRRICGVYEDRLPDWLLAVYDLEDECPSVYTDLKNLARDVIPCSFEQVFAIREFETWFISVKESLRGVHGIRNEAVTPNNYLQIRNAKGVLTDNMDGSARYIETIHQAKFSAVFDYVSAAPRCPSLQRLLTVIDTIARS